MVHLQLQEDDDGLEDHCAISTGEKHGGGGAAEQAGLPVPSVELQVGQRQKPQAVPQDAQVRDQDAKVFEAVCLPHRHGAHPL